MGTGRGREGEGSAEDKRTSTKTASNKDWKHEGEKYLRVKNRKKESVYLG